MRKMKYVLNNETDRFFILADTMAHSDVPWGDWTNAGFVVFDKTEDGEMVARCYGESVSLRLKSGTTDSEIITRAMREF